MKPLILLDPHLVNSKLFKILSEVYQVHVYGGISDLPDPVDTWIIAKWFLVDGDATNIPVKYRSRLIVMDESASADAWKKCKQARISYTTNLSNLLEKIRDVLDTSTEQELNVTKEVRVEEKVETIKTTAKPMIRDEPTSDPFSINYTIPEEKQEKKEPPKVALTAKPLTNQRGKDTIAIIQKKGGTGKTTVTETAARIIAEKGKKVLVIELDPDGGHLAARLDLFLKGTINLLNHGYSMESIIERRTVRGVVIDYILSPDFSKREMIRPDVVHSLLQEAQQDYDIILIDCGTGWDESIQTAVKMATAIWLVSAPDLAALHDGRNLYIKMIEMGIHPDKFLHLMNKSTKSKGISLQQVQSNIPISTVYLLPEDKKVEELQLQKKEPLDCKFGKKLREMIEEIFIFEAEEEDYGENRLKWWMKIPILGRLFS